MFMINGNDKTETLTDINVALSNGNTQAAIESDEMVPDISTTDDISGSGEKPKNNEAGW